MLNNKLNVIRYAGIFLPVIALFCVLFFPIQKGESAEPNQTERQIQIVNSGNARTDGSINQIGHLRNSTNLFSLCNSKSRLVNAGLPALLSPAASLCNSNSLAAADPSYNRPLASSTGTGIGNGTAGNCSLSSTGTAVKYDVYRFNLTGCAAFPTEVLITNCGPAGCQHSGNVDTLISLYRNVPAGDPLMANGGLPTPFDPAFACTNVRAGSDDLGTTSGTPNNPGGATCNQVNGASCVAPCTSPSNAGGLSGLRRQVGNGFFTVVVAGFGNTTTGSYNLYVDAPAAGCTIALVTPTAAGVSVGGRVMTANESGVQNAVVTMTDSNGVVQTAKVSSFGFYQFKDVLVGETYIFSVSHKRYQFKQASQVQVILDERSDINFIAAN